MPRRIVFILVLLCPAALQAEQIMMKSGEVYDGTIVSQTKHTLIIETKAGSKILQKMDILEVLLLSNTDQLYPTRVVIVEPQDRSEKKDATIAKTLGMHLEQNLSAAQSSDRARFKVLKTIPFSYNHAEVATEELADVAITGSYTIGPDKIGIVFKAYDTEAQNIRIERAFSINRAEVTDASLRSISVQLAESLSEAYPGRNALERAKSHEKLLSIRKRPRPHWFGSLSAGLLIPTDRLKPSTTTSTVTSLAVARQVYAPYDVYIGGHFLWQTFNKRNVDDNTVPLLGGGIGLGANFWYFKSWAATFAEFSFTALTGSTERKNRSTAEFLIHQYSFDVGVALSPFRNTTLRLGIKNNILIDGSDTHYVPGFMLGMGMRW